MKCYKCNAVLTDEGYCLKCGADVATYKIVVKASNAYYNVGLAKAQVRDLSGAVAALRTGIRINKKNIKARNLLGLVYYEMGEVAKAISEWVISLNIRADNNIADSYIRKVKANQNKLEVFNQAAKKYNFSLRKLQEDGEDVALIQLKKVVSMNPKFIKAHLLLALVYMRNGEEDRAAKYLKKVLKIDKNNTLALRYLDEINKTGIAKDDAEPETYYKNKKIGPLTGHDVILPRSSYKEPASGVLTVIYILLGVVIGVALVWFLVVPSKVQNVKQENNSIVKEYTEQLAKYSVDITILEGQIDKLTAQLSTAEDELEGYEGEDGEIALYNKLIEAANAYVNNDFESAAVMLATIDITQLPTDNAKNLHTTMSDNSNGGADAFYLAGVEAYDAGVYSDAIVYLLKSYENDGNRVETAYYLAMSYIMIKDKVNMDKYVHIMNTKFKNTDYAKQLNEYLAE